MTTPTSKKPINWEDYEYGRSSPRHGSIGSESRVHFDASSPNSTSDRLNIPRHSGGDGTSEGEGLRRRRSSLSMRVNSLAQVGGVNSIENFARSWQRAAGFYEITPSRSSFVASDDEEYSRERPQPDEERGPKKNKSLLRQQLEREGTPPESAIQEGPPETREPAQEVPGSSMLESSSYDRGSDIFSYAPHLASPFASDYGGTYKSLSRINETSRRHAARLFKEQQNTGVTEPDKEREPLLVKRVEREDGKIVNIVVGQSTLPQTVFNSVNVLIGVGLLSLPLGFKYAGWLISMTFLLFSAIVTSYTARLLAKCLDEDDSLITFADIAFLSFGQKARIATSLLFSFELIAACVALVVLFADSLDALIPGWGIMEWKLFCGVILIPLSFAPLRLLSFSSVLGIMCCLGIVLLVFVDGLIKPHTPGSLWEPAMTSLLPQQWMTLPLSFGLLMSPWGGHSVFPNIYRDMRHPSKYNKGLQITYGFTYILDLSMAVAGLLMFGDQVRDEITSNILLTKGYPQAISVCIVTFIAIIPLTKIPLNARPIFSTIEIFSGVDSRTIASSPSFVGLSGLSRGILRMTIRIGTLIVIIIIAILFPSFDRIMALMGSALCFTICIILPLAFHLKIFGKKISMKERMLNWILIVICSVMAIVGTVWAFLPKDKIGAI